MKPAEQCSLLLMRDDGNTHRWRVGLRFLSTLCVIGALLPLLLGGAGWLAWTLYQDNARLRGLYGRIEQENKALSTTLKRLSNLEHLLAMPDNARLLALQSQQARLRATEQSAPPPEPVVQGNEREREQGDAISLEPAAPQAPSIPAVDLKLIGVENVHARRLGDKLRITLDLHNSQQKNQLAGYVSCTIQAAEGESIALEIPREVASFRINRFKRAVLAPALPAAMRGLTRLTVTIEINLEDRGVVYRSAYPVDP